MDNGKKTYRLCDAVTNTYTTYSVSSKKEAHLSNFSQEFLKSTFLNKCESGHEEILEAMQNY